MKPHRKIRMKLLRLFSLSIITISMVFSASLQAHHLTPQEARSLAKEAYIWGYTMVDDIRVFNNYFPGKGGRFRVCGRERNGL